MTHLSRELVLVGRTGRREGGIAANDGRGEGRPRKVSECVKRWTGMFERRDDDKLMCCCRTGQCRGSEGWGDPLLQTPHA